MDLEDFDYPLKPESIAYFPTEHRGDSRLLVLRGNERLDRQFSDIDDFVNEGDLLVVNKTKVIPARLLVHKDTGGQIELLLIEPLDTLPIQDSRCWWAFVKPKRSLKKAANADGVARLRCGSDALTVALEPASMMVRVQADRPLLDIANQHGQVPLPPYIQRPVRAQDNQDYQSVFAQVPGAVAAPTASLHFTDAKVAELEQKGVRFASVLLHVGPGTFQPVKVDKIEEHTMHAERYQVPQQTQDMIQATKRAQKKVIAVGTTVVRSLEAWSVSAEPEGKTELFIYPGYRWRCIDGLLTNFHLPKSTLVMMVSALMGRKRVLDAYAHAQNHDYRFFSYGDAMLCIP